MAGARPHRRSGVSWVALGYVALVAYASLYPFTPWEWPDGLHVLDAGRLSWPRYWSEFDVWANALGYGPFGMLVFAAAWRSGLRTWGAFALALLLPSLVAYSLEVAQRFVELRVPSLADWLLNSGGGALGALAGVAAARLGWLERWGHWRERSFLPHSAGALALLAAWPLGLAAPLPAPLAQGRLLPWLVESASALMQERGWLDEVWLLPAGGGAPEQAAATTLGLLAPCLLLLAVCKSGWRRVPLVLSVLAVGLGMSALAAALAFGPSNAWSWLTPRTAPALAVGTGMALLAACLPARLNAALAVMVLTGLVLLVARMDPDPFYFQNLQTWEQGPRFALYGLLRWLSWTWPLLALAWVMASLARRDQGPP
jgi:VanZ family protein